MTRIKREAIEHYEKMIKWAKTQKSNEIFGHYKMMLDIKEWWKGEDCSYCQKFILRMCPLSDNKRCNEGKNCCGGLWVRMNKAQTRKTWLKYAERVLEYIKENG